MFLTTENLEAIVDLPVSLPLTQVRAADWLVVATFKLVAGQKLTFNTMNLAVIDASIAGVNLPLGDQCNQFNIKKVNNSFGIAYIGIAKNYSVTTNPSGITWSGTASDIISASSVGVYTRSASAASLELTDAGDYSFVLVNNCAASLSEVSSDELYNVDMRLVVSAQVRLTI